MGLEQMGVFKIENLTYYYPSSQKPALCEINLTVEEGEFLLVVGGSGSGKSSLARLLAGLIPGFYGGRIGGRLYYRGEEVLRGKGGIPPGEVGIVFQDPEKQLVMTEVEAEIAFGLENLNLELGEMRRRVAETAGFLGLGSLLGANVAGLSGGQKQKLALASVLAMQPRVLVLDEPTSQLDPACAEEFFNLVRRLNEEMNVTVVLIEQRLERCYHLADRVVLLEAGRVLVQGAPGEVARWQAENGFPFLPPVASLFAHLGFSRPPLTVKEGRAALGSLSVRQGERAEQVPPAAGPSPARSLKKAGPAPFKALLEMKKVWFAYPGSREEALRGVSLEVQPGELVAVLGENAAGKTTLLKLAAGLIKPGRGNVTVAGRDTKELLPHQLAGKVGYLSQNPGEYLLQETVEGELLFTLASLGREDDGRVAYILEELELKTLCRTHPRDLSSGERQRAALAAVLVAGPELLLLDEPTRGLDCRLKSRLGELLCRIAQKGTAVLLVTHDVEFAAEYAGRVVMLFHGRIAADGPAKTVLSSSFFYAPQISRLLQGRAGEPVVTFREAFALLQSLLKTPVPAGILP